MTAAVRSSGRPLSRFPRRGRRRGRLLTLAGVYSPGLGNRRDLHVYLPASYDEGTARYPVAYLQDGQNLFDPALAFVGAWGADVAADATARLGWEAILVGVSNAGAARVDEYAPFADPRIGGGRADRYLQFLLRTVKPLVDAEFRTRPGRDDTVIGGASLGGLLSLYAFFRHPEVFGRACAQSPALWFGREGIFDYVEAAPAFPGRIFLDVGHREGEGTLRNARRMRDRLLAKGYVGDVSLRYLEDRTGRHHESAWGRRLKRALPFLLAEDP